MTSWVLSLDKKEANVYLLVLVVIKMAFGITNAVIFFSRVMISCIGIVNYSSWAHIKAWPSDNYDCGDVLDQGGITIEKRQTHVRDPTKDVSVKAHMIL